MATGADTRRGQITELIGWYLRQFEKLGVEVQYFSAMDEQDALKFGADEIIIATGSMPDGLARQRWLPSEDELPGLSNGKVWSCEEVMRGQALLGKEVIVLDEGGNWRGTGTAWHLADKGHQVTIVTPDAYVAKELTRTTADEEIRRNLSKAGARFMVESVIEHWHGDSADVRSLLDGRVSRIEASALVTATTNMACNDIELALNETDSKFYVIGDCASPRSAPYAFHEGRKVGLSL